MGTNYYAVPNYLTTKPMFHIGKLSAGWKFLFHRIDKYDNWMTQEDIDTVEKWKEFLKERDVDILDEYDHLISRDEFWKMVEEHQKIESVDDFTYCDNVGGYRFTGGEFC